MKVTIQKKPSTPLPAPQLLISHVQDGQLFLRTSLGKQQVCLRANGRYCYLSRPDMWHCCEEFARYDVDRILDDADVELTVTIPAE